MTADTSVDTVRGQSGQPTHQAPAVGDRFGWLLVVAPIPAIMLVRSFPMTASARDGLRKCDWSGVQNRPTL